ncbi:hypothetical protein [Massilia sp. Root335]|uniref:hypothetical protein n=1 Tax=Massilia sp. Root335 TaxID=1736517 RepID=UPI0006FEA7E2|nr:hypothetical protein [Massilia sp. Root335]KQV52137.1 hypothetical protein ASC93_05830 [Massilia sp. Root335]
MIYTSDPQQWSALLGQPIETRILPLPDEVREFVHQVNMASGMDDAVPAPCTPDGALQADLRAALAGMPAAVRDLVSPLLLGVCVGRALGSSGVTDIVADAVDGRILGCIVLLDIDLLETHTANSWATWKENLPFGGPGFSLAATIADPHDDTRAHALQFLLLHEFGHVVTAGGTFLPRWWEPVPAASFPFLDLSWGVNAQGRFLPWDGSDFELRGVVDFYGTNKLDSDAILTAYSGLEGSDFPSLYGATNPYDDFAECFASYVHSELLGRPYLLRVDYDGVPQATLDSFWASPRSAAKRAFMRALLGPAAVLPVANDADVLVAA